MARSDLAEVVALAAPLLVPLVEEGWLQHPITTQVVREYLAPAIRLGIDTLVLGCTHYPLLEEAIREVMGPAVTLVDSGESCAHFVQEELTRLKMLSPKRKHVGRIRPLRHGRARPFPRRLGPLFWGMPPRRPARRICRGLGRSGRTPRRAG